LQNYLDCMEGKEEKTMGQESRYICNCLIPFSIITLKLLV